MMYRERKNIYTNEIIDKLVAQRNELNRQIANEIEKEKAKYKFSWKNFTIVIAIFCMPLIVYVNCKIFPKTSIWSWNHYINTGF